MWGQASVGMVHSPRVVISFPELDWTNVWCQKNSTAQKRVKRSRKGCWYGCLEKQHGWVRHTEWLSKRVKCRTPRDLPGSDVCHHKLHLQTDKLDLLTYLLTPCSTALLEKLTGLQLVKKFTAIYGIWRFVTEFTRDHHLSLSWARSIQDILPHPTSWKVKVKQSCYRPGVAQRVPGS